MAKTGANTRLTGEPWFECAICGFDFPYAERMRHYKSGLLVDSRCNDAPTHHDYLSEWNPYDTEYERISEQPVKDQGPAPGIGDLLVWGGPTKWRTAKWLHVVLIARELEWRGPQEWRRGEWTHGEAPPPVAEVLEWRADEWRTGEWKHG